MALVTSSVNGGILKVSMFAGNNRRPEACISVDYRDGSIFLILEELARVVALEPELRAACEAWDAENAPKAPALEGDRMPVNEEAA